MIMRQAESKSKAANYIDSGHIKERYIYKKFFLRNIHFLKEYPKQITETARFKKEMKAKWLSLLWIIMEILL